MIESPLIQELVDERLEAVLGERVRSTTQSAIHAVFHYVPLHSSPMGRTFGYQEGDLPVTEEISGRLLRLPFFPEITESEQCRVVEAISGFCQYRSGRVHATAVAAE